MPKVRAQELTVLGEFKPFGLIAEALDGKPSDAVPGKYDYFLFDPRTTVDTGEMDEDDLPSSSVGDGCDQELFARGIKITWSTGAPVFRKFTVPSQVVMVCWCHLGDISEAMLCVLQVDSVTLYNISGEVVSIPVPNTITSIWPLPFGLLFQSTAEGNSTTQPSFSLSPSLGAHDKSRSRREIGLSPQHNVNFVGVFDHQIKGDRSIFPSHLLLKDLLEEPQSIYVEDRGKFSIMMEFDERTIWTSDRIPLMASYNRGKMQHSVWVAEVINSSLEVAKAGLTDAVPASVLDKQFSFRRIWQGKGAQTAACKVFLATDDDAAPVVCSLLQEQKNLLSVRLQSLEINNEIVFDIKPDMSWSIPAIAAAPVTVTRPRVKVGLLPCADMIVLAPDGTLLLYSGKQCLCFSICCLLV